MACGGGGTGEERNMRRVHASLQAADVLPVTLEGVPNSILLVPPFWQMDVPSSGCGCFEGRGCRAIRA